MSGHLDRETAENALVAVELAEMDVARAQVLLRGHTYGELVPAMRQLGNVRQRLLWELGRDDDGWCPDQPVASSLEAKPRKRWTLRLKRCSDYKLSAICAALRAMGVGYEVEEGT